MSEAIICIIPARAGSKRLLNKSLVQVGGQPLISWAIRAALRANIFQHVYVSTEDKRIAQTAAMIGAEVPCLRRRSLAHDGVAMAAVGVDFTSYLNNQGERFDSVCMLNPCSPLVRTEQLRKAFDLFRSSRAEVLHSVVESARAPEQALRFVGDYLAPVGIPDMLEMQSQDFSPAYYLASISFVRTNYLLAKGSLFSDRMAGYVVDGTSAFDIHTEADVRFVNKILSCT